MIVGVEIGHHLTRDASVDARAGAVAVGAALTTSQLFLAPPLGSSIGKPDLK